MIFSLPLYIRQMRLLYRIALFSLMALCCNTISQGQTLVNPSYEIKMLIPELISNTAPISEVVEDKSGYLWFTSRNGLNCYDGQKLTTYNNNYKEGHIELGTTGNGYFQCISIDSVHLWFGEYDSNNVICFNTQTRKIEKLVDPEINNPRFVKLSQYDGEIYFYVAYENDKRSNATLLNQESADSSISFKYKDFLHDYYYFNHEHWFLTNDSIFRYDKTGNFISSLQAQHNRVGEEMYAYDESSSYSWNKQEDSFEWTFKQRPYFGKRSFKYVRSGKDYWAYNDNRELVLFDPRNNTVQEYSNELIEIATRYTYHSLKERINQILRLSNGDFLLVSETLIFKVSPKSLDEKYFKETISSGSSITSMRAITEDDKGSIYASYYTGVSVKKKGETFVDFRDTKTGDQRYQRTYSLSIKDNQLFWNHSIFNLNTGEKENLIYDKYGSHCTHLIEEDTVWMYFWNDNLLTKYVIPTESFSTVSDQLFDISYVEMSAFISNQNSNTFLAATNTNGICEIDRTGKLVKKYSIELLQSLVEGINGPVYCLNQNKKELWYGTSFGLGRLNLEDESVTVYRSDYFGGVDGVLVPRAIYFILPTDNNNFYLGTSKGLVYFETDSKIFSLLADDHPLANKEFNRNSSYKSKDGRYYVGTVDGLYSFVPSDLSFQHTVKNIPAPFINHLQVFNDDENLNRYFIDDLNDGEKIKLKPSDFSLKADFSSLMFDDEVYYSYRIKGLSDIWSPYSSNSNLEVYSLPSGEYTLEIKSTLDPLYEQDNITQLYIDKSKVWYAHWWVIGLFILGLMAIVYFLLRYRYQQKMNRQLEMEHLRTKISSDLHDDVGSILTGVAMQSEMMGYTASQDQKESFRELSDMSREAMEKMRDTVWAIDARKDKYQDLIAKMHNFAEQQLNIKHIKYRLEVEGINKEIIITPILRQNIYLIFKESITNVVKHSSASEVHILVRKKNNTLMVKVQDNGEYTTATKPDGLSSSGLGLSNMKMRAKRIGGELSIETDSGFAVVLKIPIK